MTRNRPTISATRSWISLVSSCPTTTIKFATSSAEEVLTDDIRIYWRGGRHRTVVRFLEQIRGGGFAGVVRGERDRSQQNLGSPRACLLPFNRAESSQR